MIYFCQNCFKEIPCDTAVCPFCGVDISMYDAHNFEHKLIHALQHPIPETVNIAITILGKLKSKKAVKPLKELFNKTYDPYIQKAILDTLFQIGTPQSLRFIKKMLVHESIIVRKEAEMLVKRTQ